MTECDEVATNIINSLSVAEKMYCAKDICNCDDIVKRKMPDESYTVRANVSESLHYLSKHWMHDNEGC